MVKELVDIDVPSQELAEKMSTTGIEVEGVESPAAGLSKIVVGEVLSCEDVPETHLHVCQVNVGEEEARQIVCGAPNVRAGIKVMVALPGARIADNYKIKKGKIRGLESLGMICSLGELGILTQLCLRNLQMASKSCQKMPFQVRKSSHI